jgi:hypothetical protein
LDTDSDRDRLFILNDGFCWMLIDATQAADSIKIVADLFLPFLAGHFHAAEHRRRVRSARRAGGARVDGG